MSNQIGITGNIVVGGLTAVIIKTSVAPISRMALLIQVQDELIKSGRLRERYQGYIDCARRTYSSEGILSFWKGNLAVCLAAVPNALLNSLLKARVMKLFQSSEADSSVVKLCKNIGSGFVLGGIVLTFIYSLEYVKVRLTADIKQDENYHENEQQFDGIMHVYRKTFNSDGIVGLYRGFGIAMIGIGLYRTLYWGLSEIFKPIFVGDRDSKTVLFGFGASVTLIAGLVTYPLDIIRKRMIMRSGEAVKYNGSIDCFNKIVKNEGYLSLFKGIGGTVCQGMAGAALGRIVLINMKTLYMHTFSR